MRLTVVGRGRPPHVVRAVHCDDTQPAFISISTPFKLCPDVHGYFSLTLTQLQCIVGEMVCLGLTVAFNLLHRLKRRQMFGHRSDVCLRGGSCVWLCSPFPRSYRTCGPRSASGSESCGSGSEPGQQKSSHHAQRR